MAYRLALVNTDGKRLPFGNKGMPIRVFHGLSIIGLIHSEFTLIKP